MSNCNEEQLTLECDDTNTDAVLAQSDQRSVDEIPASDHRLPTGELIDAKNTLHSFARRTARAAPEAILPPSADDPPPPRLPTGALIDAKNTMQSFGSPRRDVPRKESQDPLTETTLPSTTVEAVAIATTEPDLVYAELAPELLSTWQVTSPEDNAPHRRPGERPRSMRWCVVALVLLATMGLGLAVGVTVRPNGASDPKAEDSHTTPVTTGAPTPSPTASAVVPGGSSLAARKEILTSYINGITLSNQTISVNGTSPESMALQWMIFNDTYFDTTVLTTVDALSRQTAGFFIRQKYPLLVLWFQQSEGRPWAITDGWLVDPDVCRWYGIACTLLWDPASGGNQSAVTQISWNGINSYVGAIPVDIGLLSHMRHFTIRDTSDSSTVRGRYLTGTLPESIGHWTALTYFDVYFNELSGTLPSTIGLWTDLSYFDVSLNRLTGTLPESIGQWTSLTYFYANSNELIGTLPESIGLWNRLTYFNISRNSLTGSLPEGIGQWNVLELFSVSKNNLTGTIPSSIGNWSSIQQAYFYVNQFNGTLPDGICQYIDPDVDNLAADCDAEIICSCCTACF